MKPSFLVEFMMSLQILYSMHILISSISHQVIASKLRSCWTHFDKINNKSLPNDHYQNHPCHSMCECWNMTSITTAHNFYCCKITYLKLRALTFQHGPMSDEDYVVNPRNPPARKACSRSKWFVEFVLAFNIILFKPLQIWLFLGDLQNRSSLLWGSQAKAL